MKRQLATFVLPIPIDGLTIIADLVERLYGTGATMLQADGDTVSICAPREGLGERLRSRMPEPTGEGEDMMLRYLELRDGAASISIEDSSNAVLLVSEILRRWFLDSGGINYVETILRVPDEEPEFIFTMQRRDGQTPAQKYGDVAEKLAQVAEMLDADEPDLTALRALVSGSTDA